MPYKAQFLILLLFFSAPIHAAALPELQDLFAGNEIDVLVKGDIITKAQLKNKKTIHTANTTDEIKIPENKLIDKDISNYDLICIEKAFLPYALNTGSLLQLYNLLNSPSKLAGMKYYSITDGKEQKFILRSNLINSPDSKKLIPEKQLSSIDPERIFHFTLTDNRLGELTFRSEVFNEGGNFAVRNTCVHPVKKFLQKINEKEEYKIYYFYIYSAEHRGYFLYTINAIKIRSGYFIKLGLITPESFGNRVRAGTVHTAGLLGIDLRKILRAF